MFIRLRPSSEYLIATFPVKVDGHYYSYYLKIRGVSRLSVINYFIKNKLTVSGLSNSSFEFEGELEDFKKLNAMLELPTLSLAIRTPMLSYGDGKITFEEMYEKLLPAIFAYGLKQ